MRLLERCTLVVTATALGGGCSHNQKVASAPAAHPAPAVAAARPPARAKAPPPPVEVAKHKESGDEAIYFDFDSSTLRSDAGQVLQGVADAVRGQGHALEIDGNCDELGTTEYNLALGEARARAAKDYLVHMGVPADRITTLSYGSERPKDPGHDESAHAKNRRDDLVVR